MSDSCGTCRARAVEPPGFFPLIRCWLLLAMIAAMPFPCWANPETGFDAANRLYEEKVNMPRLQRHMSSSARLIPVSAALLFNRGNAFFKAGQVGRAIVAYREAQAIAPRDPDIRANLRFARDRVRGPTVAISRLDQMAGQNDVERMDRAHNRSAVALDPAADTVPMETAVAVQPALVCGGPRRGTVVCGACLAISLRESRATNVAVVTSGGTVHQGPFEGSPSAFAVQDGAELLVLDRKQGWLQVSNGLAEHRLVAPGPGGSHFRWLPFLTILPGKTLLVIAPFPQDFILWQTTEKNCPDSPFTRSGREPLGIGSRTGCSCG